VEEKQEGKKKNQQSEEAHFFAFPFFPHKNRETTGPHLMSTAAHPRCFMLLNNLMFGGIQCVPSRPLRVLYLSKRPKDFLGDLTMLSH
jgi:hypothetical protein